MFLMLRFLVLLVEVATEVPWLKIVSCVADRWSQSLMRIQVIKSVRLLTLFISEYVFLNSS